MTKKKQTIAPEPEPFDFSIFRVENIDYDNAGKVARMLFSADSERDQRSASLIFFTSILEAIKDEEVELVDRAADALRGAIFSMSPASDTAIDTFVRQLLQKPSGKKGATA